MIEVPKFNIHEINLGICLDDCYIIYIYNKCMCSSRNKLLSSWFKRRFKVVKPPFVPGNSTVWMLVNITLHPQASPCKKGLAKEGTWTILVEQQSETPYKPPYPNQPWHWTLSPFQGPAWRTLAAKAWMASRCRMDVAVTIILANQRTP